MALSSSAAIHFAGAQNLMKFDDLPATANGTAVTNGYGGLQWVNFGFINGVFERGSGYYNGLISSNNVAFNMYGSPASFSDATPFNLSSAYLTTAFVANMQIEVTGVSNGVVIYDTNYSVSNNAPTLVNFNPAPVTQVTFTAHPASQFAMDNLTIYGGVTNNPPPPPPPPPGLVQIGTVVVTNIGHVFENDELLPGEPASPAYVRDYLIDQSQYSDGGGLLPSVVVNWDTNSQFTLSIAAPAGEQFLVQVPPAQSAGFAGYLWWQTTRGGFSPSGPVNVTFGGLQGTAPDFSGSSAQLSSSDGFFGCVNIQSSGFTSSIAFTSMTITGTVLSLPTGLGSLDFVPDPNSILELAYTSSQSTDPGPFVTLVPAGQPLSSSTQGPPALSLQVQPNGDIAVTYSGGVLQCATNSHGAFTDIPGNGTQTWTFCKTNQTSQQFFRVRSN